MSWKGIMTNMTMKNCSGWLGSGMIDSENTAKMMSEMTAAIEKGAESSSMISDVLNEITEASSQTLIQSEKILKSSGEQSDKIREVVNIIESIVVVSEETSAGTEQIAASSSELSAGMNSYQEKSQLLNEIAEKLQSNLDYFKLKE